MRSRENKFISISKIHFGHSQTPSLASFWGWQSKRFKMYRKASQNSFPVTALRKINRFCKVTLHPGQLLQFIYQIFLTIRIETFGPVGHTIHLLQGYQIRFDLIDQCCYFADITLTPVIGILPMIDIVSQEGQSLILCFDFHDQ